MEMIDSDIRNDNGVFPDEETLSRCEIFKFLGQEVEDYYYELWKLVKYK